MNSARSEQIVESSTLYQAVLRSQSRSRNRSRGVTAISSGVGAGAEVYFQFVGVVGAGVYF